MTIACPDCGSVQTVPPVPPHGTALCRNCESPLERTAGRSLDAALACATATFLLLFPANMLPFLRVSMAGASRQSLLASGIAILLRQGWPILALLIAAFVVVIPFIYFGLTIITLGALRLNRRPHWLGRAFRWVTILRVWAMPDVFLVACAIGYSRVVAYLPVHIGAGGYCFIAVAFLCMVSHAALDQGSVWRTIMAPPERPAAGPLLSCLGCDLVLPIAAEGRRCPRCRARLRARKPDALARPGALALAGYLLYIPANVYPMTTELQMGQTKGHTIFTGIAELAAATCGRWPS